LKKQVSISRSISGDGSLSGDVRKITSLEAAFPQNRSPFFHSCCTTHSFGGLDPLPCTEPLSLEDLSIDLESGIEDEAGVKLNEVRESLLDGVREA
jgi:phosphoribosylanthranilate isomerase